MKAGSKIFGFLILVLFPIFLVIVVFSGPNFLDSRKELGTRIGVIIYATVALLVYFLPSSWRRKQNTPTGRKWGEPWSDSEMQQYKQIDSGYHRYPSYPYEPFCLNPNCGAPITDRGMPWIERPTISFAAHCKRCKSIYSISVDIARFGIGGPYMDVVHRGEFGGARFYPFNRKPDPPPDDYSKHSYLVGYIDPSTNVLRQEAYRAKTPKEAADAVAGGVSAELRYDFGIDKDVEVIWVKDEKGEVQDHLRQD